MNVTITHSEAACNSYSPSTTVVYVNGFLQENIHL